LRQNYQTTALVGRCEAEIDVGTVAEKIRFVRQSIEARIALL